MDVRTPPIRFGNFEVDLASGELRKNGERIRLQEQPFQTLVALLERPGEVLTREDLQKRLWPAEHTAEKDDDIVRCRRLTLHQVPRRGLARDQAIERLDRRFCSLQDPTL